MSGVALDTNAYRALDDGDAALSRMVQTATSVALPVTVIGELYFGIFDGKRRELNSANLNRLISLPRSVILHIDQQTALLYGEISAQLKKIGKPMQQNDVWIAALCKQHGYPLATADKGFRVVTGLEALTF